MASVTEQLTPAGQGNLQQIKAGKPIVEALFQMAEDPIKENEKLLFHILEKNKDTEYGKKYGFAQIHSIEDYQKKVPVSVYDDYAGYILRMSENGEENLITSGKVVHYNKSSGTVGNPKRIPLTEESFQIFQKYNGPYRMGLIAKELGFDEKSCEDLKRAALLHDIGKIGIPDRILNKPGKLTDEEYGIMKSHVTKGAEILKSFTIVDHVEEGALYHHERYDGKGYMQGLKGEEIPLNARIIGIADTFDAMTANRVYRKKLDKDYVLGEIRRGSGTQFDPKLVDIMLRLIDSGRIDIDNLYKDGEADEDK